MRVRLIESSDRPLPLDTFRPGDIVIGLDSGHPRLVVGLKAGKVQGCAYLPVASTDDYCAFRTVDDLSGSRFFRVGRLIIEGEGVPCE